jgi:hypothetical protein
MLQSPENFHLRKSFFHRALNRISFGYIDRLIERFRILINTPKNRAREFPVDWQSIPYSRIELINRIVSQYPEKNLVTYLEIGCAGNKLFDRVVAGIKTGVDPFSGGNIRMTSDRFFQINKGVFDVIFIDGLHEYQQVRRDVANALDSLHVGGYIGIHDMLPRNWIEANVPCLRQGPWSGDVWKVAFDLMRTDGVEFVIFNIDYGIGLVRKLEKHVTLATCPNIISRTYDFYAENRVLLPIIEYDDYFIGV